MQQIDLHVHSTRSDGTYTPSQLVDYAIEKGLAAFALTDHDTVDGLEEAISYADMLRTRQIESDAPHPLSPIPEVIPGIEFSTAYQRQDVHIVAPYIDYRNEIFTAK